MALNKRKLKSGGFCFDGFSSSVAMYSKGPFIHIANAFNANTNATATFERFCHSNRARTRTRKTVDGFCIIRTYLTKQYGVWPLYFINTLITVDFPVKFTCKKKCITSEYSHEFISTVKTL